MIHYASQEAQRKLTVSSHVIFLLVNMSTYGQHCNKGHVCSRRAVPVTSYGNTRVLLANYAEHKNAVGLTCLPSNVLYA